MRTRRPQDDVVAAFPERRYQHRPRHARLAVAGRRVLLCHGSPRKINEFLWKSTSPEPFLEKLCDDYDADVIVCTHSGLHWRRALASGRHVVNAGVIGRPANDGRTNVWYTIADITRDRVDVEFVPVDYDFRALAQ